jgi:adenylate kinase family enzyme
VTAQQARLIIIRGNSGSGKSTLAAQLRKQLREQTGRKTALIEQDYLRRIVLAERGGGQEGKADNVALIEQTALFALNRGYDVIVEGILTFSGYGSMLQRLISECPCHLIYYFDVSFEETLRRHATKPNAHEFGETEMRQWWIANDITGFPGERILSEHSTLDEHLETILRDLASISGSTPSA